MAEQPIPRWVGIALLLAIAVAFGANHVAARVAFDHGANVTTAVAFRSAGTALFVLGLLLANGVSLALPAATRARAALIGLMLAVQSYCLYSAVALIPVALALLAFQTFPMVLALLSWAAGAERPSRRVLLAMPVALAGLALALEVYGGSGDVAGRWSEIGEGVLWATGASLAFASVLLFTTKWLPAVDGRLRSFLIMSMVAASTIAGGAAAGDFRLPADNTGWIALALLVALYGTAITSMFVVLPRLGAVNNALVLNFEPIAVLAIAWVVLEQRIAPLQVLGAFIVVGAIIATGK
ncbi:MAG: DMT family transporter, partial [Betaproteobacteria bacterium]|nr:DMT family transporter [Betaproteobacteria bacterium]